MILLLGASGYVGQAFARELRSREFVFETLSRWELDYSHLCSLLRHLQTIQPKFLINAAGYTGKQNVDACDQERAEMILGNVILPERIAQACSVLNIPWAHVSSGCIYAGAKIIGEEGMRVEKDLTEPQIMSLCENRPELIQGFTEEDEPNFSFRHPPCNFYSGAKALAEEILEEYGNLYIWRLRIPFDEQDHPRNFLTKVQTYPKIYNNVNSISHLGDFVNACLDLFELEAPFGTYNVTNTGFVTTRQVVGRIQRFLDPNRDFVFWENDNELNQKTGAPWSNCVLDNSKLTQAGVSIRTAEEALEDSLLHWSSTRELVS